ncbi:TetR family transcriptional regulator [Microbispora sp. NPDC088329]|uniref:TetR/AcrR family transcriptional regulator n=1 Tax=Microbispora sp. NPDC088329 TaxID=3154869 RepID=UPI003424AD61
MATRARGPERRQEPLSRERIVGAAVELLDTVGEGGLTFRALAERLATGPGAIYWHVTGKTELLAAAGQNAANAASTASAGAERPGVDRAVLLDAVSAAWKELDPGDYPFTRAVADQVRGHDDREQFLDGIALILAGIAVSHSLTT